MDTQVRSVLATAPVPVPWAVAVRLTTLPATRSDERVRRVVLGVPLPSVTAVDVVTVRERASGHELLTDVRPVRRRVRPGGDTGADPDVTLADVLTGLAVDGAVPVAVAGTPFAHDVLAALARIPVGARRTYGGLAADVGRPRAVRAVASVMARNRAPLVLPCHRVVPSAGGPGRYGWGEPVKAALLAIESDA